ncbi:MAG: hypothetical protein WC365_07690 [Candidatus Babeliales bacterium]|jgi:hypothetical protein
MGDDIKGYLEINDGLWQTVEEIPDDRHYDLFGLLAGVRNYVNANSISEPKGVPDTMGKKTEMSIEKYDMVGYGYSYLTITEIDDYDWNQTFHDGRVSTIDKSTGKALSKASYTNPDYVDKNKYELKYLDVVAKDLIPESWQKLFQKMRKLAEQYGKDNVRIVFWFI